MKQALDEPQPGMSRAARPGRRGGVTEPQGGVTEPCGGVTAPQRLSQQPGTPVGPTHDGDTEASPGAPCSPPARMHRGLRPSRPYRDHRPRVGTWGLWCDPKGWGVAGAGHWGKEAAGLGFVFFLGVGFLFFLCVGVPGVIGKEAGFKPNGDPVTFGVDRKLLG